MIFSFKFRERTGTKLRITVVFTNRTIVGHCFSAENESKLLLWWQKIFELGLRQIDFGGDQRPVVRALLTLVSSLITLGEDKSSTGFLGAIGLGRKSALSLRSVAHCKSKANIHVISSSN